MKKSLSLLLAIALVISMFGSMAYAADTLTAQQQFDALKEKGIFTGINEAGDAGLENDMTRAQFARVAALLLGLDVDTVPAKSNFTDVPLTHWAVEEVNAVDAAGVMNGKGQGKFDPSGNVTIEQLARVLVDALGLEVDEDAVVEGASAWAGGFVAAAIKAGLISADADFKADAKRELLVTAAFTADAAIEAAKEAAKTLTVTDVVANNLKTVYVHFSVAVNKDTVNNDTVKVEGKGADKVALSADGKVASIVLTNKLDQSTEIEVKVNGVKTADGKEVKDFSKKVIAADTTIPVATGAKFVNHKEIELQFSEPMDYRSTFFQGLSEIKIDGATALVKAVPDYATNTISLEFPSLLKDGTHKIEVANIPDFAGYKILPASFDVVVVEDKDAPVLTGATVKNRSTIEVTFNEKLSASGEFKVNGTAATVNLDGSKVTLTGFNLTLGAVVEVKLAYKGQKDVVGNEIKDELTYTFKVSDDTELPTIAVSVEGGNKLVLTFSKPMQATGDIKILNDDKSDRRVVAAWNFKNADNNTIELASADTGLNGINGGTFYVNIKNMKDATVRENPLPEQTIEVKAKDSKAPTVNARYTVDAGRTTGDNPGADDTVTFYFDEAMDADTAKNLSNYVLAGPIPLTAVSDAKFHSISADGKRITLTVPNVASDTPAITVYALKDVAGNMMGAQTVNAAAATRLQIATAKAVSKNKVEVDFGQPVAIADPSAFAVIYMDNGNEKVIPFVNASIDGNKVAFTTSQDLNAAAEEVGYELKLTNANALQNPFGEKMRPAAADRDAINGEAIANGDIVDGIKPSVAKSEVPNTNAAQFVITFDEKVVGPGIGGALVAADVTVRDKDNVILTPTTHYTLALADNVITITLVKADYNDKISVEIEAGVLADEANTPNTNNYIKVVSGNVHEVNAPVGAVPVATGVTNRAADLVVTFDEALYVRGVAVADATDLKNSFTASAGVTITSATYNSGAKTITFAITGAVDTSAIAAKTDINKLTDRYGNAYAKTYTYVLADTKWNSN